VTAAPITIHVVRVTRPHRSGCIDPELREILASHLGAPPDIVVDDRGKPSLRDGRLAFSLAHTETLAIVAVSAVGPLGVDIERITRMGAIGGARHHAALARRYFTADEAAAVASAPESFYRLWTRKEAWVKAQGGGLAIPLDTVDLRGDVAGWFIDDLDVDAEHAAAIARPGSLSPIVYTPRR